MKGNKNIFICDASIFGKFVSSNIHAPVVLMAKMFSISLSPKPHAS